MRLVEMIIKYENGDIVYIENGTELSEVSFDGVVGVAVFDKTIPALLAGELAKVTDNIEYKEINID